MVHLAIYIIRLFSYTPLWILYRISDILYFITYYIIGYRKKIITTNIEKSFPEKSTQEKKKIIKEFYKNFCDFIVETLKNFSMPKKEYDKRMALKNIDIILDCKKEGKDIILLAGHIFNWEWLAGIASDLKIENTYAVYKTIRNKDFNDFVIKSRTRFGTTTLSMDQVVRTMMKTENNGSNGYLFVADQSPFREDIFHDIEFLNQTTPVFIGYDKIAIKKNYSVIYANMRKVKRGHYEVSLEKIEPNGDKFESLEIVNQFFDKLTQNIYQQPSLWLWSHKRWKYKRGRDYTL